MTPIPRRKGYLSNTLVDIQRELRRLTPRTSGGLLTSRTTMGVTRRPIAKRVKAATGGGPARWS